MSLNFNYLKMINAHFVEIELANSKQMNTLNNVFIESNKLFLFYCEQVNKTS